VLWLDTVNTYNGNLTIKLPIGLSRSNNGNTAWGLSLVYNAKNFDYRASGGSAMAQCHPSSQYEYWYRAWPLSRTHRSALV